MTEEAPAATVATPDRTDPTTIAPVKAHARHKALYPDLFNHMPSRFVTHAEAVREDWTFFYTGESCSYGHVAPRYTNNPRLCVDCFRMRRDMPLIGGKSAPKHVKAYKQRKAGGKEPAKTLGREERQFLEAYAETRSLEAAASAIGTILSKMLVRIAAKPALKAAVADLEKRIGVKSVMAPPEVDEPKRKAFHWTQAKRDKLIETWVDTGDIATARDAISVTPSQYLRELDSNKAFAAAVAAATPQAELMLEERAYQLALKGNDRLLTKILSVKKPEYRDNLKLDVQQKTTVTLDDAALNARLAMLLGKYRGDVIDAIDVTDVGHGEHARLAIEVREIGAPGDARGDATPLLGKQASDVLPGQGEVSEGALPATYRVLSSGEDSQ